MNKPTKPLRSYTLTTYEDNEHVQNGRCPMYALCWSHEYNKKHWPDGHNYFLGNSQNITIADLTLRKKLYTQFVKSDK